MKGSPALRIGIVIGLVCLLLSVLGALFLNWERGDRNPAIKTVALPDFETTKKRAESGDLEAENSLGELYAEGKQVRQDYGEAAKWYRKAADRGLAKAQYNLGVLYDIGQGVTKDEAEAAKWYRQAAEKGNADAQYTLASMFGLGRGVVRDTQQALYWYQRAAEQGDALACYNLAERYERGKDVAEDPVEAYKWHSLAADRGLPDAATARANLARKMTSGQLTEARKRIRHFKAQISSKSQ